MMKQVILELSKEQLVVLPLIAAEHCHRYEFASVLCSQGYSNDKHSSQETSYDLLAGFGIHEQLIQRAGSISEDPDFFERNSHVHIFGHISYDYKNILEPKLYSQYNDSIGFPMLSFVTPSIVLTAKENVVVLYYYDASEKQANDLKNAILQCLVKDSGAIKASFHFSATSFEEYRSAFENIHNHLQRGDIYEINYCIPIRGNVEQFDPADAWLQLSKLNPAPFSCLYRNNDSWLISASPERFMRREGQRLFSQPMKGTTRRSADAAEDDALRETLAANAKEISENIMIVDLVRNDLSRVANKNSVVVDELCGMYSFPKVHQMISTVVAELKPDAKFYDIVRALFPMGSMTGAPKIRAMEIINERETFARGLFSGTVGYIAPGGDFDFNVVIRSMLFNESTNALLIPAGSAITIHANARDEYAECQLKVKAMLEMLGVEENLYTFE